MPTSSSIWTMPRAATGRMGDARGYATGASGGPRARRQSQRPRYGVGVVGDRWAPIWCWRTGFTDVTDLVTAGYCDFSSASHLHPGMKICRRHRGEDHWVYVVPPISGFPATWEARRWGRYIYRGHRYKSLTAVARLIIGDDVGNPRPNGDRFFGLRRRRRGWRR